MKPIAIHDLSRYRGELMGVAMLVVMLFHVGGNRHETIWLCMGRCGNVGVDMFLFLSGIGLWYSLSSRPWGGVRSRLSTFYRRRLLRIYPA